MFETILRALLTFLAHAIAATHLAPLKYSKSITYSLWAVFVLGHSVLAFFLPSVQWATPSLLFTVYMLACVLHVLLFFITTTGRLGQRAFLILSYTVFFTACCGITDYFRCFLLPPDSMWYLLIYGAALGLALYVLLGRLRPAFPEAAMFKAKEWRLLSALMVMFFVLLTTWFVYPNRMSHFTRAQAAGFPAAVLLLFATYGTIFICVRTVSGAERAEQMRMQLDLLTLQVQTQQKTVEDARRSRHDLRHNNLLLLALAEKGETQNKIGGVQKNTAEGYRADKVLFVITTDGMENASREFNSAKVKSMIANQKSKHGWEFIFLGANIDAVEVADRFGVDRSRAQNFHNDSEGIALNYEVLSQTLASFRAAPKGAALDKDWSAEIQEDYKKRGGKR